MKKSSLGLGILLITTAFSGSNPSESEPIDITEAANMGFTDEVAGDRKGGWTDSGPRNDMRDLKPGDYDFSGIRFHVLNPDSNGGRSCMVFSGRDKDYFLDSAVILMNGKRFRYLYLFHATSTVPSTPAVLGNIEVVFTDGTHDRIDVTSWVDVNNWWYPEDLPNGAVAWRGVNFYTGIGLYVSKHPLQEKPISEIRIVPGGTAVWMIVGMSGSIRDLPLPMQDHLLVSEGDRIKKFSEPMLANGQVRWTGITGNGNKVHFSSSQEAGQSFRFQASLEGEPGWMGAAQELSEFLDGDSTLPFLRELQQSISQDARRYRSGDGSILEILPMQAEVRFISAGGTEKLRLTDFMANKQVVTTSVPLSPGEAMYGTGERFNGVYLNRFEYSTLDLGSANDGMCSFAQHDAPLDCYIFLQDDPKEILAQYARLTGHAPIPPEWAFENWVSRYGGTDRIFSTTAGVKEYVFNMEKHNLPFTSIVIEGWPTYDFGKLEELKQLVSWLHGKGKKVIVYDQCGRLHTGGNDPYLNPAVSSPKKYLVQDSSGRTEIFRWYSYRPAFNENGRKVSYLDLTNPQARKWWFHDIMKVLLDDIGVDGAKIDFTEWFPEGDELVFHSGRSPRGMHHFYPVWFNTLSYRNFQFYRPEGGMCWSRGGGIGAQRYPFLWCGDQNREFFFLKPQLSAKLSAGMSGIPYMANDLGGFSPTTILEEKDRENRIFLRGAQLDCFGVTMHVHGRVKAPFEFDSLTIAIYRRYARIHYTLIPYLVEQAEEISRTGVPLMRHLYLEFPDDTAVYNIDDEYLLGPDLLVAPVLNDVIERNVYLPEGEWIDLNTGEILKGRRFMSKYPALLDVIPVFCRKNPISSSIEDVLDELTELMK